MHGARHPAPVASAHFGVVRVRNGHREPLVVDFGGRWVADEKMELADQLTSKPVLKFKKQKTSLCVAEYIDAHIEINFHLTTINIDFLLGHAA